MDDFEMVGSLTLADIEQNTKIRFKNIDDFKSYYKAIDVDYDSEDVIFSKWFYKLNTPEFEK